MKRLIIPVLLIPMLAIGTVFVSQASTVHAVAVAESPTTTPPIVIDGQSNITISGVKISSADGNCITIRNSSNIRIENSDIGPCLGEGVGIQSSNNITVTQNRFENIRTGVYVVSSQTIDVSNNQFLNVQGPMPRGQFVQFNQVSGAGNRVNGNVGENVLGESMAEDAISLYKSQGTSDDPIQIIGNKIKGGGPSDSGGGIMTGDKGGSYIIVKDNILVDPGQYGIAAAGGFHIQLLDNKIYARQQSFTNVGMYVAPFPDTTPCGDITVRGNQVNWTNKDGNPNPAWTNGKCGTVTGWNENSWGANIDSTIWDEGTTILSNLAPIADAGPDHTLTDSDGDGSESVALDGLGSSDPDGTIASYEWKEGATILGTIASITPSLSVGTHTITLTVTDDGGATGSDAVVITVNFETVEPIQLTLPGRIQAEDFRKGGERVGYHDTTSGNFGGEYRSEDVDIQSTTDVGGGFNVGWIATGEWLAYDVSVAETGTYDITARVASNVSGVKALHLELDGADVTGSISWTDSSGWQSWLDVTATGVRLTAGSHELRIVMDGEKFNVNYLDVVSSEPLANLAPQADAGADQTLTDSDGDGSESVALDGSGSSDQDGTIASYQWKEGATVLGTTASISPSLSVGSHTITLTVTDDGGATGSDTVMVTVNANQAPTANAGSDRTVTDNDNSAFEEVTLDGSGSSDPDGSIASYEWKEGATDLGTTAIISPSLPVGTHSITLTATDNGGATGSDGASATVTIVVTPTTPGTLSNTVNVISSVTDFHIPTNGTAATTTSEPGPGPSLVFWGLVGIAGVFPVLIIFGLGRWYGLRQRVADKMG